MRYDAIVIGAGQSGMPFARASAGHGWKTALVERLHVAGTCINEGCTPTKTMVASARVAHLVRRAPDYGVRTGPVAVDLERVRRRKRDIVESWRSSSERRLRETEGLDLLMGSARFTGAHTLEVRLNEGGHLKLEAERIVIDVGSRPSVPDLPGLADVDALDSTSIMELGAVPAHLVILGGGYVGVEFGQMMRRFGSEVTVIQRSRQLLPREDADVADAVAELFREDGIEVLLNARARRAERAPGGDGVRLTVDSPAGERRVDGSHLLVATGRTPNTDDLGLDAAGIVTHGDGTIRVDARLQTSVPGVYATGDVKGGPAFTHISFDDFRILRTNLLEGGDASIEGRLVPYVVFIDPQLGRVGMTEEEARRRGRDVKIARLAMDQVSRALEVDEPRGMMKAVVDARTDLVLGAAVLGLEGGEIMAVIETAMMGGLTAARLREAVYTHPTLAESLNSLFATME